MKHLFTLVRHLSLWIFFSLLGNYLHAQCITPSPGQVAVEIQINTGSNYGNEISWNLKDSAGTTVASVPSNTYNINSSTYGPTANANHQLCLDTGATYTFEAYDSFGDSWNGGTYEIRTACLKTVLANNNGNSPNNGISTGGAFDLESVETFTVFPESLIDMGVTAINEPLNPLQAGLQSIKVQVENFGTDTLFNYTIHWEVDGVAQPPFVGTSPIAPCGASTEITLGSYTFANAPTTITSWSATAGDNSSSNDSATVNLCPGMSGTYTIDALSPGSSTNFQSFATLINGLNNCGISGAVTVNVVNASGPYTEQVIFTDFPGISAVNTLTINGNNNTITYNPLTNDKRIVGFDHARHITLNDLIITTASSNFGFGIHFMNESDSNTIQNCTVNLASITSTSSTNSAGLVMSGSIASPASDGDNGNYNIINGCTITGSASGGPYYGVYLNGQGSGADCRVNAISNCTISDFRAYGVYIDEGDSTHISGNTIGRPNRTAITTFYGVYSTGKTQNSLIEKNVISNIAGGNPTSTSAAYGIFHSSADANVGAENRVVNNIMHTMNSSGTIYALYNNSSNGVWYYHNTIDIGSFASNSGITRGFYQTSTASNIHFQNNIIAISRNTSGTIHGLYFNSSGSTIISNTNGIYVSQGNVGRYGGVDYSSMANWQSANGGAYDQNSVFSNPGFTQPNTGDLTPQSLALNDIGASLGVTTDIYGVNRATNPDPGAIEFSPPANDVLVAELIGLPEVGRQNSLSALSATQSIQATVVNNGVNTQSNIPITYTLNGVSVNEVVSGPIVSGDSVTYTFSTTANLMAVGTYSLAVYTALSSDTLSLNDTVFTTIRSLENIPVTLPHVADFETADNVVHQNNYMGLDGITRWDFETMTANSGRVQTQSGFANSGNKALSLDRSTGGTVVNYVIETMNLSNYTLNDSILVSFSYRDHGEENHTNDRVWVRGSESDSWIEIYNLFANKAPNNWKHVSDLNITDYLANNTQSFSSTTQIRFGQEDNSTLGGDGFTFDDIEWSVLSATDIGITSIDSIANSCGLSNTQLVGVTLKNYGYNPINAGSNVQVTILGANAPVTETITLSSTLPVGGQQGVVLTSTVDLSTPNTYQLKAYTSLVGDTIDMSNDTGYATITHIPLVDTYPYFEDFDQGDGGWISGGQNNSWELTTPNNTVINSAISTPNSWVTNASGNYNASENSYVEGPCFDFTNTPTNPHVAVKIWYEAEFSWDGMAVQYTTDGSTWNTIGNVGDDYNWYTDGTINGNPGGQATGWTGRNGSGSNGWITAAHELDSNALGGQSNVKFRMVFGADGAVHDEGVAFDNFAIGTPMEIDLGNDSTVCGGFVFDPNLPAGGEYKWSTGDTTPTIELTNNGSTTTAQTLSLIYIDSLGFPAFDTIVFNVSPSLQPQINSPLIYSTYHVSCFDGSDGQVKNTTTGGVGTLTYMWNGPNGFSASTDSLINVGAGTYYFSVTDSLGCMASDSVTLEEPNSINVNASATANVSCFGNTDGMASVATTGTVGAISYAWSNGATMSAISSLAAGTYSVTITDSLGCFSADTVSITQPGLLAADINITAGITCNGASNASANSVISGGTAPYSYAWNNGATLASTTNLSANTYTITVTDANSCTALDTITISQPAILQANVTGTSNVSCFNGSNGSTSSMPIGGTGPYSYMWSTGDTSALLSNMVAGSYTVTVTDANGCSATGATTITQPAATTAQVTIDSNVTCNGLSNGGATASISGGTAPYSYAWNNTATTASITGVMAATYSVTITDANSCTSTSSGTITQPAANGVNVVIDSNVTCNGLSNGGATASGSGGTMPYSYAWNNAATTASITGIAAASYTVTLTDANGCTVTGTAAITEPAILATAMTVDSNVSCNGLSNGGATVNGSGGTSPYSYAWSNAATTASITGVPANTYSITLTDANGCSTTNSTVISEPIALSATASVDSNVTCNGLNNGGLTANATGGTAPYAYSWNNSGTTSILTGISAGTYSVTVTDANGCSATATNTVTEPLAITQTITVNSNVLCFGGTNGSLSTSVNGGVTPYNYAWSNGTTTANNSSLSAGMYTVTVTDANGCIHTDSSAITSPTAMIANTSTVLNVTCNGNMDGEVTASPVGGTPGYTYAWNNGATTATNSNLLAGLYTVTITDGNGCTITDTAGVSEPPVLTAAVMITTHPGCDGVDPGDAYAMEFGGTAPYTYVWSDGTTGSSINGFSGPTLAVTITDANGCTAVDSASVYNPSSSSATIDVEACDSYTSPSGQYTWDVSGVYTDVIQNAVGCDSNITINLTITTIDNGVTQTGTTLTANHPTGTYQWIDCNTNQPLPGDTSQSFTPTVSGNYAVIITDNNCSDTSDCVLMDGLGIVEIATEIAVKIYPNPVMTQSNQITIEVDHAPKYDVVIRDVAGKTVYQEQNIQTRRQQVDISNFAAGPYFIEVKAGEKRSYNKLIVL